MKTERGASRVPRRKRRTEPFSPDAYRPAGKPKAASCIDCHAIFRRGRWTRAAAPAAGATLRCPACRRVRERLPAGYVALGGEFLRAHRGEILNLLYRCEADESARHALERIMTVEAVPRGVFVTTTGIHLARRIGDALHDAYKGRLRLRYNKAEKLLRVSWSR